MKKDLFFIRYGNAIPLLLPRPATSLSAIFSFDQSAIFRLFLNAVNGPLLGLCFFYVFQLHLLLHSPIIAFPRSATSNVPGPASESIAPTSTLSPDQADLGEQIARYCFISSWRAAMTAFAAFYGYFRVRISL